MRACARARFRAVWSIVEDVPEEAAVLFPGLTSFMKIEVAILHLVNEAVFNFRGSSLKYVRIFYKKKKSCLFTTSGGIVELQ